MIELANDGCIRIGIIGSGRIANKFVKDVQSLSNLRIVSVFGIHEDSIARFAKEHGISQYTTEFDLFLSGVDAVYIATPHPTHYAYSKLAILAGKHVLCEKPLTLSKNEAKELFSLAQSRGVILMEALKTAYCPGFIKVISTLDSGIIGDIKYVDAKFTKLVPWDVSEMQRNASGGSLTTLISYPLLVIFVVFGINYVNVKFSSIFGNGVDIFTKCDITYPEAIATGVVGLGVKAEGDLVISGTKGYIYVPAPWWKTQVFYVKGENPNKVVTYSCPFKGEGLEYEVVEFLKLIGGGPRQLSSEISIKMAEVIETFMVENQWI